MNETQRGQVFRCSINFPACVVFSGFRRLMISPTRLLRFSVRTPRFVSFRSSSLDVMGFRVKYCRTNPSTSNFLQHKNRQTLISSTEKKMHKNYPSPGVSVPDGLSFFDFFDGPVDAMALPLSCLRLVPAINQSIDQPTNQSIDRPINQPTNQSLNQSINRTNKQPIYQTTRNRRNQSINWEITIICFDKKDKKERIFFEKKPSKDFRKICAIKFDEW